MDIAIDTQRTIDAVDPVAYKYYYRRLHERARKKAEEEGMGTSNLMSVLHIAWEFELHALAHKAGHPSAGITNLNYEETVWTMIARGLG